MHFLHLRDKGGNSANILLLAIVALFSSSVFGQASLSTHTLILPDTSYLGSNDTAIITVKNVGDSSYTGPVTIRFSADTITFTPFSFCSGSQITLNPSDTIQAICYVAFKSAYVQPGNNIVVVWSSGNLKAMPADTARDSVYILIPPMGISGGSNSLADHSFVLYPSIVNNHISLEYTGNLLVKKHIRLIDIYGRRVDETEYAVLPSSTDFITSIDVSQLKQGIYFIELYLEGNRRLYRKFVKVGM